MSEKILSVIGSTLSRRHLSSSSQVSTYSSRSNSFRSSTRYGFDSDEPANTKAARIQFRNYFSESIDPEKTVLSEVVTLRVLKLDGDMTNLRASLVRWKKYKAKLVLADGRLRCELQGKGKKQVVWTYEVTLIKNLAYKRKGVKEFGISFANDSKLLNVVVDSSESAMKWIVSIFAEVRAQATVFEICLNQILSPSWKKVLQKGILLNDSQLDKNGMIKLSPQEEQELLMEDDKMNIAEICLREQVDLWALCRGADHPDVCDSYEKLSIWLKKNMRHEEGSYWEKAAEEGRKNYTYKLKVELNPADNQLGKSMEKTPLDELRNPGGMNPMDQLFEARNQNSKVDFNKRVDMVLKVLTESREGNILAAAKDGKVDARDEFDDLI